MNALKALKLQVEELGNALPKLSERDRAFASSLCSQFWGRGLSPKQSEWVGKLLQRVLAPEPQGQQVGNLNGIVELLATARAHLKRPAILIRANNRDLRLSLAGPSAKVPGSINVCSVGSFTDRDWYGRVTREGEFQPSQKLDNDTLTAVASALTAMALNPAKAAAEYGHLTGFCCFCGRSLTDDRSTSVGYGPICAGHYGLPWGDADSVAMIAADQEADRAEVRMARRDAKIGALA